MSLTIQKKQEEYIMVYESGETQGILISGVLKAGAENPTDELQRSRLLIESNPM